ncbi:MAG TPA: PGPGW domain-containing protein, partial [Rubricoccaceae bacterium]
LAVLAAGVFLLPAPGPGFLVVALGAALVAQESLAAARAADKTEVWLRGVAAWGIRVWRRSSGGVKGLIVLAALALAGLGAWAAYHVIFGR